MTKQRLVVLFAVKSVTALVMVCCFLPFLFEARDAYQLLAVRKYASVGSSSGDGVFQLGLDTSFRKWKDGLKDTQLIGVGSTKIGRIDLIRRYGKTPVEFSFCVYCEADYQVLKQEADANIAKVNQLYDEYRARMVTIHGELAVADEEDRNRSDESQIDQASWSWLCCLLLICYLCSCAARLPFLALRSYFQGHRLIIEFLTPDRIPAMALFYPVIEIGFVFTKPIDSFKRTLGWILWCLMSVLSFGVSGAGKASAQSGTGKAGGKRASGYVWTVDAREERELVEGEGNTVTLRTMLSQAGKKAFMEAFLFDKSSSAGNSASFLLTPGFTLLRKANADNKLTLNLIGGWRHLRTESAAGNVVHQNRLVFGSEFFALRKNFQFYNPAARFELQPKSGGLKLFTYTAQLLARGSTGKRFWVGPEGNFTKQWGRPHTGYIGGVVAIDPKPGKSRIEFGLFKALLPTGPAPLSLRARLIYNFAF